MFFSHKKRHEMPYLWLVAVILAVILVILGFALLRSVFFPLIISALWAIILKIIKNSIKNFFFKA